MDTELEATTLTTSGVADDGNSVSLGFVDSHGRPVTITMPLAQVGALIMTLPRLIDMALQKKFGDCSLQWSFPMASWAVVQYAEDPSMGMMTLRTTDGFSVTFSIARQQQRELGAALLGQPLPEWFPGVPEDGKLPN